MNLRTLLGDDVPDVEVSGITDDSRRVMPGFLFCAVRGSSTDGHHYMADAVRSGASAIVCEAMPGDLARIDVPVLVEPELGRVRGRLAARFHGDPSRDMKCIGVTGTNGKTSVTFHLANMLELVGQPAAYLGTIGWGRTGHLQAADSTTASAIINQERLACLRDNGVRWIAMEASSHALAQGRVDDIAFAAAVFTNLTRDHLDYHGDMASYAAAKRRLFELPGVGVGVINADDEFGRRLAGELSAHLPTITYGRKDAGITWTNLRAGPASMRGRWDTPWGSSLFELPVVGEFSVANAAAALGTLAALGFDLHELVDAQRRLPAVPGRMQFYPIPDGPLVVIDYAHTPDALTVVLSALRKHCQKELVCVFGCGGDRDAGKRPLMAATAETLADVLWLTSDNPRREDPEQILEDMRAGLSGKGCVYECVDRADAIRRAITCAGQGDLVLVAGKGHEDYQEFATGRVPYSDRGVVTQIMRQKAYD